MMNQKLNVNFSNLLMHGFGLLLFIPFSYYRGTDPLTSFANEWLAFAVGLLLMVFFLFFLKSSTLKIPAVVNLPISLGLVIALQIVLMPDMVFANAHLAILYLLWAVLLMIVAANLTEWLNMEKITTVFCWYLVAGGIWNVCYEFNHLTFVDGNIGILSIFGTGSIGQQNHLCLYMFFASCSLIFLFIKKNVNGPIFFVAALLFAVEMSISGSRSSFLYMAASGVLIWLWRSKLAVATFKRLYQSFLLLTLFFLAWQTCISLIGFDTGAVRAITYVSDSSTPHYRFWFWRDAWEIFLQSPWLGAGFGEFDWAFYMHGLTHWHGPIDNRVENAHNLFLQVMAEMGLAGLLSLVIFGGLWLKQFWQNCSKQPMLERWWLFAVLTALGIHSLLEYPFWYSYFLGIFALLAGITDARIYSLPISKFTLRSCVSIPVVALLLLVQTGWDFLLLEKYYEPVRLGKPAPGNANELAAVSNASLLKNFGIKFFAVMFPLQADNLEEHAEFNAKALRFEPIPPLAYKQAAYQALQGNQEEALLLLRHAASDYPKEYKSFILQISALPNAEQEKLVFLVLDKTARELAERK